MHPDLPPLMRTECTARCFFSCTSWRRNCPRLPPVSPLTLTSCGASPCDAPQSAVLPPVVHRCGFVRGLWLTFAAGAGGGGCYRVGADSEEARPLVRERCLSTYATDELFFCISASTPGSAAALHSSQGGERPAAPTPHPHNPPNGRTPLQVPSCMAAAPVPLVRVLPRGLSPNRSTTAPNVEPSPLPRNHCPRHHNYGPCCRSPNSPFKNRAC